VANFTRLSLTSTCEKAKGKSEMLPMRNSQSIEASPSSTQASLAKLGTPSKHVSASSCCHALSIIDRALATRVRFTMHCCLFGAGISPWQQQSGPACAAPHLASSVMALALAPKSRLGRAKLRTGAEHGPALTNRCLEGRPSMALALVCSSSFDASATNLL